MKGQPGIHEIGWLAGVLVGHETGLDLLDIVQAAVFELVVEPVLHDG